MAFELEAVRQHPAETARARINVEHPITSIASEVVVMGCCDAGAFVPIRASRESDRRDHAVLEEATDHAIHRPDAEGWHASGCRFLDLLDGQRTARGLNGFTDRPLLGGISSCHPGLPPGSYPDLENAPSVGVRDILAIDN